MNVKLVHVCLVIQVLHADSNAIPAWYINNIVLILIDLINKKNTLSLLFKQSINILNVLFHRVITL